MSSLCLARERLEHPVYPACPAAITPPSFPCHPESSTKGGQCRVTIDTLPDVALLAIFDFYVDKAQTEAWQKLVHVCQKWRNIVFGSPRRLDLRLHCRARTPVRETLDVWPLLPIVLRGDGHEKWGLDNIFAALEHNDRVCDLDLTGFPSPQLEKVLAAMQRPFPILTRLMLQSRDETAPINPDSFLGGSTARLRSLGLEYIPFPGLPNLLLSATHLVHLGLWTIPDSGYISPEAMVTCLSVLTRLESLAIGFKSPRCRPDHRHPPPHTLLPVLTNLEFRGVCEYLEDLVARIDAPLLDKLDITFFHQPIFNTPQLAQFISRSPKFKAHEAYVVFCDWVVWVALPPTFDDGRLDLGISCRQSDWQLSSLAQVCSSSFPQTLISSVERLYIENRLSPWHWQDDIESSQWLELFRPFIAVKNIYLSREFVPRIAPALQELVKERVTEVLPALQTLFLEEPLPSGPVQETIGQFVVARQLAGHLIGVSRWARKEDGSSQETDDD